MPQGFSKLMNKRLLSILLVEDSPSDAKLFQKILASASKQLGSLFCAERLSDAIHACSHTLFDVALLDLSLPDSEGWETVANFHAAAPDIPIVVFTGSDDEEIAMQALAHGAHDYLVKGTITYPILVRAIRYAIERGQIFKQLRANQQRFWGIFNQAFQLMGLLTPEGRFLEINQTSLEFFNAKPEDFIGKLIWELDFWESSEATQRWLQTSLAQALEGEIIRDEIEVSGIFGRKIFLDFSLKSVKDETGKVAFLIVEGRDISDRKRAEAALQDANEQLQAVLNAVPGFVAWISEDLRYLGVNRTMAEFFNLTPDAFVGRKLGSLKNSPDCLGIISDFMASSNLTTNQVLEIETNGTIQNHLIVAQKYQQGKAAVMVGIDITERKRAEAEIFKALEKERELNLIKTSFLSMVSHDFRTPITTIQMSSELLEKYLQDSMDDRKKRHFVRIKEAVTQMLQLLDEVLLISKSESGKLLFNATSLNLEKFCRDLLETMQVNTGNQSRIKFTFQGVHCEAKMDISLLRHILTNLLGNAIKYSPMGSLVCFDCICQGDTVTFLIKDSGIGIPLKDQVKLFETFHRASNVGSIPGTGLGLSIVKKCVEVHRGEIEIQSQEGVGTTFTVRLPLR